MIEPFEYEKTKTQVNLRDSTVKNDTLDESSLDTQLRKLNHFKKKGEFDSFLETEKPFTSNFKDRIGRVKEGDRNKSFYQDENVAARGSMVTDYETREMSNVIDRESASVLISRYLDSEVGYVPPRMETVDAVENIKASDPVLTPGITFIDSRKNMATRLQ